MNQRGKFASPLFKVRLPPRFQLKHPGKSEVLADTETFQEVCFPKLFSLHALIRRFSVKENLKFSLAKCQLIFSCRCKIYSYCFQRGK